MNGCISSKKLDGYTSLDTEWVHNLKILRVHEIKNTGWVHKVKETGRVHKL